jgi:hypothetical protein
LPGRAKANLMDFLGRSKHRALEDAIEKENHRPLPNDLEINTLKKQKLRIKDELASLSS